MLLQQAPFIDRANFGNFLNEKKLKGVAVEIGTHRGEFAAQLLSQWKGKLLHCIDPWEAGYDDTDPVSQLDREADYRHALKSLLPHHKRYNVIRDVSTSAARQIERQTLDFVYIDGNHQREYVEKDVVTWWPKLKDGGILAGHDIICPGEPDAGWGVNIQPVVLDFAARRNLTVYLVVEMQCLPWSWYVEKK